MYTTSTNTIVEPQYINNNFGGANIISNTYENGVGIIKFDTEVTSIGQGTFWGCSSLTSITIPDSVTSIGVNAFYNCSELTSIVIGKSLTDIESNAFIMNSNKITSVVWNAVNCSDFSKDSDNPFYDLWSKITSFEFGDSVKHIPSYMCCYMDKLTTITIPNSVTSIGKCTFMNCSGLTSVVINAITPPNIGTDVFHVTSSNLYVPDESVDAYKAAANWSTYADRIKPMS